MCPIVQVPALKSPDLSIVEDVSVSLALVTHTAHQIEQAHSESNSNDKTEEIDMANRHIYKPKIVGIALSTPHTISDLIQCLFCELIWSRSIFTRMYSRITMNSWYKMNKSMAKLVMSGDPTPQE